MRPMKTRRSSDEGWVRGMAARPVELRSPRRRAHGHRWHQKGTILEIAHRRVSPKRAKSGRGRRRHCGEHQHQSSGLIYYYLAKRSGSLPRCSKRAYSASAIEAIARTRIKIEPEEATLRASSDSTSTIRNANEVHSPGDDREYPQRVPSRPARASKRDLPANDSRHYRRGGRGRVPRRERRGRPAQSISACDVLKFQPRDISRNLQARGWQRGTRSRAGRK